MTRVVDADTVWAAALERELPFVVRQVMEWEPLAPAEASLRRGDN